jgi:hypothetical protein
VAAGAIISTIPTVRKLGFAIQEVVRMEIPRICDKDNSRTRHLGLAQSSALELSISIFSANTRKMEISLSQYQSLVTMLRSPGHYRRTKSVAFPHINDDPNTLRTKWMQWVEAESFKRVSHVVL